MLYLVNNYTVYFLTCYHGDLTTATVYTVDREFFVGINFCLFNVRSPGLVFVARHYR